ncbi:prevent-host-death protein [Pasteurellaceae bacterium RH1A]|nr:prevent-host-death protein [Pasteurellaceae bacterium RH1A]
MTIMTSREFNQRLSQAQKAALIEPVIITNRGEPAFVLLSYAAYTKQSKSSQNILDMLADTAPACADIELELQPRSIGQRPEVEF